MSTIAGHPMLTVPPTAHGVALALAEVFRPGRYVIGEDGYDTLDVAALAADIEMVSTGEAVLLGVIRSLAGEGVADLSRLDALDRERRRLLADALATLAG